jgi:hypothetical protein
MLESCLRHGKAQPDHVHMLLSIDEGRASGVRLPEAVSLLAASEPLQNRHPFGCIGGGYGTPESMSIIASTM